MATHNWSTAIFLRINALVGTYPALDRLMLFAADKLVYVLVLTSLVWATTDLVGQDPQLLNQYLKLMITAFVFGIGISWTIGALLPNPRPIRSFPNIHQLLTPMSTWKSFPSDHTIGSMTVATITMLMGAPVWLVIVLYVLALSIAVGRVFVGVHYPRDIVGGIGIGLLVSLASPQLLLYSTEPLYRVITVLFV